jgi:hypothetical protein
MDTGNKAFFNLLKIIMTVFEFAMYSLELEIKFKNKMKFNSDLPTLYFFTTLAETQHFFFCMALFIQLHSGQ